jgi:hypothetical protein
MKKKKLTLEDLKLESFLTELDDSKLIKVQGGMGGYEVVEDYSNTCNPDEGQTQADCEETAAQCVEDTLNTDNWQCADGESDAPCNGTDYCTTRGVEDETDGCGFSVTCGGFEGC